MLQKAISLVQNMAWLLGPGIGVLMVIKPILPSGQSYIKRTGNSTACRFDSEIFICSSCYNLLLDLGFNYTLWSVISIHCAEYNYRGKVVQVSTPWISVTESSCGNFISYNYFRLVSPIRKAGESQCFVAIYKEKLHSLNDCGLVELVVGESRNLVTLTTLQLTDNLSYNLIFVPDTQACFFENFVAFSCSLACK
jgi:hypothetical protein